MINKFRAFSKTKLAAFFVFLIAVPFVFWGMGGAFRSGNTNNIVCGEHKWMFLWENKNKNKNERGTK